MGEGDVDYALVVSSLANEATATNSAPRVTFDLPAQDSAITPGMLTLTANAEDTDGNVAKVTFNLNGLMVEDYFDAPFSVLWDTTSLPAGSYSLTAIAFDNPGATSAPATRTFVLKDVPASCERTALAATGLPLPITDFKSSTSILSIDTVGTIESLSVSAAATHGYRGDLRVTLISPTGKHTTIFATPGPGANLALEKATPRFDGDAMKGTWKLEVFDAGDEGTLDPWALSIKPRCF